MFNARKGITIVALSVGFAVPASAAQAATTLTSWQGSATTQSLKWAAPVADITDAPIAPTAPSSYIKGDETLTQGSYGKGTTPLAPDSYVKG